MDNISGHKNKYEAIESFYQQIERMKNRLEENRKFLNDSSQSDVLTVWKCSEEALLESYHKTIVAEGSFSRTYTFKALENELRDQRRLLYGNGDALLSKPTEVTVNLWIEHLRMLLLNIPQMPKEQVELDELDRKRGEIA